MSTIQQKNSPKSFIFPLGRLLLCIVVSTSVASCAAVKRTYGPVIVEEPVQASRTVEQNPYTDGAIVLARTADGWEARLTKPPTCTAHIVERSDRKRTVSKELAPVDKVLKWGGYIGAGVVAGLVGTGLARGGDSGDGLIILGAYALPLAGVGVVETIRELDEVETLEPEFNQYNQTTDCKDDNRWVEASLSHDSGEENVVRLSTDWTPIDLTDAAGFASGETSVTMPLSLVENQLTAQLPAMAEAATIARLEPENAPETLEAEDKDAVAEKDPTNELPAEEGDAGRVTDKSPSIELVALTPSTGVAPATIAGTESAPGSGEPRRDGGDTLAEEEERLASADEEKPAVSPVKEEAATPSTLDSIVAELDPCTEFRDQPTMAYVVEEGDWLSKLSRKHLSDTQAYPYLQKMNQEQVSNPDRIYVGQALHLPAGPVDSKVLKAVLGGDCR